MIKADFDNYHNLVLRQFIVFSPPYSILQAGMRLTLRPGTIDENMLPWPKLSVYWKATAHKNKDSPKILMLTPKMSDKGPYGGRYSHVLKDNFMLQINTFIYASSPGDAYDILCSQPGSVILGGCGYLKLGDRTIDTAIDLSKLNLDYISETDSGIEIGAMTRFRSLETHALTTSLANGVLPSAVKNIVGVQFRTAVTVGGTVSGRYPFSDLITALLALDARLCFYKRGQITLETFLKEKPTRDVLEKLILPNDGRRAAFSSVRKTTTDYAVLNCATAQVDERYRVVIGSRPGRATRALPAEQYLDHYGLSEASISEAARLSAVNVTFGDNPRGSARYRACLCPVLVTRTLREVMHAA